MDRSLLCVQDCLFCRRVSFPMAKQGNLADEEDKWPRVH